LTVAELFADSFSVSLIPTTLQSTTLGKRKGGDTVNIETDVLGKYVKKYVQAMSGGGTVTEDLLRRSGFVE
jgi:riboflavin synthase